MSIGQTDLGFVIIFRACVLIEFSGPFSAKIFSPGK